LNLPTNRIVAFAGPYIAVVSGGIATWLVHVLGVFHINQSQAANTVTQGLTFAVTAGVVWLGHQKWLSGWIAHEERTLEHDAPAALVKAVEQPTTATPTPPAAVPTPPATS